MMMRLIITILMALVVVNAHAAQGIWNYRQNTASVNLTATFPSSPQFTGPTYAFTQVDVYNGTSGDIEVNCSLSSQPPSNAASSVYIPAGLPYTMKGPYLSNQCSYRSVSGTLSSGVITSNAVGY